MILERRDWFLWLVSSIVWRIPGRDFAYIEELWTRWSPDLSLDAKYMTELKTCLRDSLPAPLGYYRALRPSPAVAALTRELAENPISVPTLYLGGADDGCITYALGEGQEQFFSAGFKSECVESAGHFMHVERPEWIANRLLEWFAGA